MVSLTLKRQSGISGQSKRKPYRCDTADTYALQLLFGLKRTHAFCEYKKVSTTISVPV